MRLKIEQPALATLLSRAVGVVEKRNVIPILSNVLLSTDDGILTCTATDLDISVTSTAAATVETQGATTVNAQLAASIVGKMPKGRLITLEDKGGRLTISSGSASFDLATLPAEDFPELASAEFQSEFTCAAADLKRVLDLAAFAQSTEETRYYLNGIYLHPVDGKLRGVATDGHRLAQVDSQIETDMPGVILPRKAVAELRKALTEGDVQVSVSETKFKVVADGTTILSKVVDGTFPDYTRVIPQGYDVKVVVDAEEMKVASDLVALVSGEKSKAVRLSFEADECRMEVNGPNDKGTECVPVDKEGADLVTGFSARYLADALAHVGTERVEMRFKDGMSPCVIVPEGRDDVLYVVMPMRQV